MGPPNQFISPGQWSAIKGTVSLLNEADAANQDLPDWLFQLRDQLTDLLIATSLPVQPFAVSQHLAYLLQLYVAGSEMEDVAAGSQLVVDWAKQTLESCAAMGIQPVENGEECVWLVVQAIGEDRL